MGKADGEVTQLVLVAGDGQLAKRFNVVIVAEGYRKVDQATFEADALAVANAIVGAEPFAGLAAAINIFNPEAVLISSRTFDIEPGAFDRLVEMSRARAQKPLAEGCAIVRAAGDVRDGAIASIIHHISGSIGPIF